MTANTIVNNASGQQQLDLFSDAVYTKEPESESQEYDVLDYQLATLMRQLQGSDNTTISEVLKQATLEISRSTREGKIAVSCSDLFETKKKKHLLQARVVGEAGDYQPLIIDQDYLYLRRYWQYQQQLADQINARIAQSDKKSLTDDALLPSLARYFPDDSSDKNSAEETNWQRIAAEQAIKYPFLVISGGPGTGKTTTITRILALLIEASELHKNAKNRGGVLSNTHKESHLRILLAAPTGKAAIRMLDAIREAQNTLDLPAEYQQQMPQQATTLHKLLGYIPEKVNFKYNRHNLLNADVVLVDEASMIDIALMEKLVEAVPPEAKLILIGDKNQLASVETGSVFSDICDGLYQQKSEQIVTLKKNWRFSQNSGIGQLALASRKADVNTVLGVLEDNRFPDCRLVSPQILKNLKLDVSLFSSWKQYFEILKDPNATIENLFLAFQEYRILCALRKGFDGSVSLNKRIEKQLSSNGWLDLDERQNWYHGRPVMVVQNDYSKGLFNGDTGLCLKRKGQLSVWFPDSDKSVDKSSQSSLDAGFRAYSPIRLPAHETTWAITIHKSQGSEFENITLVLPHEKMPLLTRQLIYTGITRAKQSLTIISSKQVLSAGIKSVAPVATQIAKKIKV